MSLKMFISQMLMRASDARRAEREIDNHRNGLDLKFIVIADKTLERAQNDLQHRYYFISVYLGHIQTFTDNRII